MIHKIVDRIVADYGITSIGEENLRKDLLVLVTEAYKEGYIEGGIYALKGNTNV